MAANLSDLTDKEKEALRLLLAGHDAKSSAAELDISVHTINDRLRNARRKLHVSSSREAARILGDAEGGAPQKSARTSFGITQSGIPGDNADLNNTQPRKVFGLTWFAGGMLIMSLTIAAAVIGMIYFADDGATTTANPAEEEIVAPTDISIEDAQSLDLARAFIGYIDAGDYAGSWEAAGPYFQSETTADQWEQIAKPVREQLGAVMERRVASVQRTSSLPGSPDGEYEVVQFHTVFSEVEGIAVETMIMLKGEAGWQVAGYFVRPALN